VREEKVLRVRCHKCKRSLGCLYAAGVKRYGWYSSKVEGIFAVLSVHQVDESCAAEIAEHLGYPIKQETRAAWQGTRALASIDEFKLGYWWMYTLTDVASQVIVDYALCESRDEEVVRELIAKHDPEVMISDGCSSIQAACAYFADKPNPMVAAGSTSSRMS
jgi:transposase-like protein